MRLMVAVVGVVAALSSLSVAQAQSIASVGGPKESPPESYSGQQYVDSRGCVFLRAGYGGQTTWVPRVDAQRKALCGYPPTFGKAQTEIAKKAPAPTPRAAAAPVPPAKPPAAPAPKSRSAAIDPATYTPAPYTAPGTRKVRATAAPTVRVAPSAPVRVAAPAPSTDTAPKGTYEVARSGPGPGKIGCFTSAPVAEVVRLRNGGTAVVCTRGDGGLSGWRPPIYPAGSPVGVALTDPGAQTTAKARSAHGNAPKSTAKPTVQVADAGAVAAIPHPPKGYKLAWTDDRLNPRRGQRTQAGDAAQDQIWTRDVPARLVAEQPLKPERVSVSTKARAKAVGGSDLGQPAGSRGGLVQVGTFGVAANADGAAARLAALGLPVTKGRTSRAGQSLQIVFAGPFTSGAEAQAALSVARRAGFSDAFLR